MTGTPDLGFCVYCLDAVCREFGGVMARKDVRICDDPQADEPTYYAPNSAAAVDAFERGARVNVGGFLLRMRADVIAPPRCVDHYRQSETYGRR